MKKIQSTENTVIILYESNNITDKYISKNWQIYKESFLKNKVIVENFNTWLDKMSTT